MHRKLRIIGVIVGGILLLLLIAPFFIPVNQFRPTIEREASAVLGRKVQVGNLSLSLLRGKLSAENLVIADDARFSSTPFLTATSVSLDVDVLPLVFSRELRVSSVSIEKPSVTLLHDAKDNWNYASLGTSATKASPQTSTAKTPSGARGAAASVFIKKLELNDGRVVVGATASKERSVYDHVKVVANNFSMSSEFSVSAAASLPGNGNFKFEGNVGPINTGDATLTPVKASIFLTNPELTLVRHRSGGWSWSFVGISAGGNAKPKPETASAEPTTLPTSFLLRKLELKNGRVLIGSEDSNERNAFGQVNVTVDNFSVASQCTYNIIATGPVGEKVKINGKAGPINQTNPALTPVRANILVEKPQLKLVHDKAGSWSWSIGAISSADMKQDAKAPPLKAESAKAESPILPTGLFLDRLELKDGSVSVSDPRAKQPSLYQHVNVLATSVGMDAKFPFSISADLPAGGNIKMDGTFGPLDRVEPGFSPLSTKLTVRALDLASTGFLDPALGLGGVVELDAVLTAQSGIEETKGTAKLSRALLVSGGSPSAVPATVEFTTRFDQRTDKGVLNPSTIRIGAAEARLSGTYQIEPDTTVINIKLLGNGMPAKDLQSFLPSVGIRVPKGAALTQGTLNANLDIQGPTNRLVTNGQLGLLGAKMAGFDLGAQMASVSSLTGIKTGTVLVIESLTTNVHMATNGLRFDGFNAVVPPLGALDGSGTVDARNNLNLKMAATITSGLAGSVGAMAGSLGSFLGQKSGCKGGSRGTVIPFQIQGTAAEPKFVPDVGGTAASLFGSGGCVGSPAPKKKS